MMRESRNRGAAIACWLFVCAVLLAPAVQADLTSGTENGAAPGPFLPLGTGGGCVEDFDGVTAPALPGGWTTSFVNGASCSAGSDWTTDTAAPDTAPNAAFHNDPNCITDNYLDSPVFTPQAGAQLTFRNNYNMESNFDGGVLEISVNAGPWTDIISAGGSWVSGGYNGTISASFQSPIAGRMAWTGNSNGYLTTTVDLPPAAIGQSVSLRFRMASDVSVSSQFWRVDTIDVTPCGGGGGGPVSVLEIPTMSSSGLAALGLLLIAAAFVWMRRNA